MTDSRIDADKQAIQEVLDRLFDSYKSKDIDLMLSCYAPDLVTMMPFGEPTYGLDEWRSLLENAFESGTVLHVEVDTEEILIKGDWAFEWHSEWAQRMRIPSNEEHANFLRAMQLFHRQPNGEWKIARYIANSVPIEDDFHGLIRKIRTNSKRGREKLEGMPGLRDTER